MEKDEEGRGTSAAREAAVEIDPARADLATLVARREERHDDLWGSEPIYETQPEDEQYISCCGMCEDDGTRHDAAARGGAASLSCRVPNLWRVCFFTWSGDRVHRAVREELDLLHLLGPVKGSRAYDCGKKLSLALQKQWGERHCWRPLLGHVVTRRGRDGDSSRRRGAAAASPSSLATRHPSGGVGILCYVGTVASYTAGRRSPSGGGVTRAARTEQWGGKGYAGHRFFAGVLWLHPPLAFSSSGGEGPGAPLRSGQDAQVEAAATWLNAETIEKLLPAATGERAAALLATHSATYEEVEHILFLSSTTPQQAVEESQAQLGDELFECKAPRPMSVMRALLSALGGHLWRLGYWRALMDATTFAAPLVLKSYIAYLHHGRRDGSRHGGDGGGHKDSGSSGGEGNIALGGNDEEWWSGVSIVLLFFFVSFVHSVSLQKYTQLCYRCFYTFRSALGAVILEKALTIEAKSLSLPGLHAGRIVNMLTNDVEQLEQLCILLWPTMVAPLEIGFSTYFLYHLIGPAVFAGLGVVISFTPIQMYLTYKVYRCYVDLAQATDARLKATNEFLSGVRAAKFMSWEPIFLAKIQAKRDAEMALLKRSQNLFTILSCVTDVVPNVMIAVLFAVYFFTGNSLSPQVIYPTLSFATLMCLPLRLLPLYANWMSSFVVAMQRITAFLERPDAEDNEEHRAQLAPSPPSPFSPLGTQQHLRHPPMPSRQGARRDGSRAYAVEFHNATITAFASEPLPSFSAALEQGKGGNREQTGAMAGTLLAPGVDTQRHAKQLQEANCCYLKPVHVLTDITLNIPKDKFTVIIGPTGSGKSSLLTSLLGALEVTRGTILLRENDRSSIAYVPERPWVMDASVEDNILFFDSLDRERLHATLAATQLLTDLAALPDGIATRVGERGISLSGGQQARLALARAVYARGKDLYLLDDPLSALDARVAQLVVDQCLRDLLKGKTRVLATHQTHVAQYADHVVVLAEGRVEFEGDYQSYKTYARDSGYKGRRSGFVEFSGAMLPVTRPNSVAGLDALIDMGVGSPVGMSAFLRPQRDDSGAGVVEDGENSATPLSISATPIQSMRGGPENTHDNGGVDGDGGGSANANEHGDDTVPLLSMANEEERARGAVPRALYKRYIKACGGQSALLLFITGFVLSEGMMVSSNLWLSYWSGHPAAPAAVPGEANSSSSSSSSSSAASSACNTTMDDGHAFPPGGKSLSERASVYIYLACVLVGGMGMPLRFLVSFRMLRRGCRVLHANLLLSLSRATLGFFDTVPHGRLLNRFARDVHIIDGQLISVIVIFAMCVVYLTSSLLIMVGSQLMTIAIVIPFGLLFYRINIFNCAMVRSLQRLDNVATTPVVSVLGDLLSGRWTIAAFHKSSDMLLKALRRIDTKFSSSYTIVVGQVWVGVRVQMLSALLLSSVAFLGVLSRHVSWVHINLGLISLTITNASSFTAVLSRLMDATAALEASMNSVERVVQYTDNAPQEGGGFFREGSGDDDETERVSPHRHFTSTSTHDDDDIAGRYARARHERSTRGEEAGGGGGGAGATSSPANALAAIHARHGKGNSTVRRNRAQEREEGEARAASIEEDDLDDTRSPLLLSHVTYDATKQQQQQPVRGCLELQHVYLRYRPGLPLVLQDLSFTVRPGERVGVVGRTGSGKSSLMLVLMQLIDITAGSVRVNGRDVSSFDTVEALRRLFAIIPQDPVLFDGSVRTNLDPLQESTDAEVWSALRHVGMADYCTGAGQAAKADGDTAGRESTSREHGQQRKTVAGLDTPITEGGKNLSVGQRQLLCLARALLRRGSCFLLMDEATASVDGAMDHQIQQVVSREFPQHTILSIAHRLHTVARYDRILMLDGGRVACFGTPQELMEGVEGDGTVAPSPFAQLVLSMGPEAVRSFLARMRKDSDPRD